MKKVKWVMVPLFLTVGFLVSIHADAQGTGDMNIEFEGLEDPEKGILDPESPNTEVEPIGDYGKTEGPLRIDFVPSINFSTNKISFNTVNYPADSVLFKGTIASRGNFIQVSDYREKQTGWSLQVRQETQFTNQKKASSQLDGAMLSFDKSWISSHTSASMKQPIVSKEVIYLRNIGETYTLAQAEKGTGGGTWSIVFGTSIGNDKGDTSTVYPRLDDQGQPIAKSSQNNQTVYLNDAVNLLVPGRSKKEAGTYSTVLTWIISELP